ncbi:MAG: site-specific integrase [Chromatiales bacterium]|nr:site-specific integrase [Chromatiales bacterium]
MATIEKRGPAQWRVKIRRRGYPLETRTFETRAAAERYARAIETEMDSGTFVSRAEAESTTLAELLERYLNEITATKKGADAEAYRIRAMLRHPLAARIVATLRGTDIAAYRDERLATVTPGTVKREIVILGHLFETARKEWGIHVENPVRMIRAPASPRPRERRFEGDEEARLLDACGQSRNPFLVPVVRLALETAMRRGELVGLRWEHVDLDRRVAHLPDTKNGESRSVPLSSVAVDTLRPLEPHPAEGAVFPDLTTEAVKLAFARALRRAEIEGLRFHDLRHEATSRLFERGLNIMEVSAITGHKDLSMLKRYTHLRAEDLARKLG